MAFRNEMNSFMRSIKECSRLKQIVAPTTTVTDQRTAEPWSQWNISRVFKALWNKNFVKSLDLEFLIVL